MNLREMIRMQRQYEVPPARPTSPIPKVWWESPLAISLVSGLMVGVASPLTSYLIDRAKAQRQQREALVLAAEANRGRTLALATTMLLRVSELSLAFESCERDHRKDELCDGWDRASTEALVVAAQLDRAFGPLPREDSLRRATAEQFRRVLWKGHPPVGSGLVRRPLPRDMFWDEKPRDWEERTLALELHLAESLFIERRSDGNAVLIRHLLALMRLDLEAVVQELVRPVDRGSTGS